MIYSHGTNHSRGVLVLISDQLQCELKTVKCDENGRFVFIEALIQESPYLLLNLYAPTKQNKQLLEMNMRLFDYIIQGKILRSQSNWHENGEKNSKIFLNLENNKTRKTAIRRLLND